MPGRRRLRLAHSMSQARVRLNSAKRHTLANRLSLEVKQADDAFYQKLPELDKNLAESARRIYELHHKPIDHLTSISEAVTHLVRQLGERDRCESCINDFIRAHSPIALADLRNLIGSVTPPG